MKFQKMINNILVDVMHLCGMWFAIKQNHLRVYITDKKNFKKVVETLENSKLCNRYFYFDTCQMKNYQVHMIDIASKPIK